MTERAQDPETLKGLAEDAEETRKFLSNDGKKDRERWILKHWATASGLSMASVEESEGPDFVVDGVGVEVVEVQPPGRRRGDEYRADRDALGQGKLPDWRDWVDLELVLSEAHQWVAKAISEKANKYWSSADGWILLVYANYGSCEMTNWQAVRDHVREKVHTFKEVDVIDASGDDIVKVKP